MSQWIEQAKCNYCGEAFPIEDKLQNDLGEYFCSQDCLNQDERDNAEARYEAMNDLD